MLTIAGACPQDRCELPRKEAPPWQQGHCVSYSLQRLIVCFIPRGLSHVGQEREVEPRAGSAARMDHRGSYSVIQPGEQWFGAFWVVDHNRGRYSTALSTVDEDEGSQPFEMFATIFPNHALVCIFLLSCDAQKFLPPDPHTTVHARFAVVRCAAWARGSDGIRRDDRGVRQSEREVMS